MDDIDQQILAALRRDGRATHSDIADHLKLSRATVRTRIERMIARGDIAGFTVLSRADVTRAPVRGLMMIGIEGRGADRITARLLGLPAVQAVHSTNGKWDLMAEIGTQTLEELDEVIAHIRRFDGVLISETNLLLSTRKPAKRL
ncbi:Lrp/AsnC family transcriptional regulator [Paracoccus seriniphilus]|uniref:Transcriptional regulator, AsnC family n=1 Tax=Paracoccus seriniphilus TaxID=184748 RepID=A0A239PV13_9RHOB|nr:Lrp/AsnC family transcriptional regulator [Paracoccus seriniphilus]WCR15474.1 Lrp/AsnC family transcriptional regulator [Paracoccus seriniphilus]SNT73968.1 transcriptional regulator, AsnC family [Paracoccus seriniphilus]